MSILNENLNWEQIKASDGKAKGSFDGYPSKTMYWPSQMLVRAITMDSKKNIFSSPWWMDWNEVNQALSLSSRYNIVPSEMLRGELAIAPKFNPKLDGLVQIILSKPVYVWKGKASSQKVEERMLCLIGGGSQLYIPNLKADEFGLFSNFAPRGCFFMLSDTPRVGIRVRAV